MATGYVSADQQDKIFQALQEQRKKKFEEDREQELQADLDSLKKKAKTAMEYDKQATKLREKYQRELDKTLADSAQADRQKAIDAEAKYRAIVLKNSTAEERAAILQTSALAKRKQLEELENAKKKRQELIAAFGESTENPLIKKEIDELKQFIDQTSSRASDLAKESREEAIGSAELVAGNKKASKEERADAAKILKQLLSENKKDAAAKNALHKLQEADYQAQVEERRASRDDEKTRQKEERAFRAEQLKHLVGIGDGWAGSFQAFRELASEGFDNMMKSIDQPISTFFEYQAKYEARLLGSENAYNKMMSNINKQIGLSPFVKQTKMVENIQRLIDSGVNYNIELRAYLATVTEGIASTFDAFDSNLLRLIRIQQNDSTAARLGMESALTQMLNSMYSDTSYLGSGGGSGLSDSVTAALLDASAQMSHQAAAEMEFMAQKWLGSLYALGVSDSAIQSIAQGLGYIGSGNIEALSSNDSLMSLLSMSASRGGTTISEILSGGLTADNTNKLLQGMVEYLAEIANNTDSTNVTRSSIAQVFGLTNTDLRSISNLTNNDISKIAQQQLTYSDALAETNYQLSQMYTRTHISTMLNNVIENATTGMALTIGGNPVLYGMAKALNLVSGLVGDRGLEIPGIQAMGTGTASGIDILSIAKAGIMGTAALSTLIGSLNSIAGGGLPKLSSYKGYEESLRRGNGLEFKRRGVQSGFSESAQYNSRGSSSTSDLGSSAMQSANESAKSNQSEEDQKTADLAETFYEEGLQHLATIADLMQTLTQETITYRNYVTIDPAAPVSVTLADTQTNDGKKAINVNLTSMDLQMQQLLVQMIKSGMLGESSELFGTDTYQENTNANIWQQLRDQLTGLPVTVEGSVFGSDSTLAGLL